FFQAEDGIRDLTVTGVQTCALPISGFRVAKNNWVAGLVATPGDTVKPARWTPTGALEVLPLPPGLTLGLAYDVNSSGVAVGFAVDRKSTRLNSSHSQNSYAVFCLKK